MQTTRMVSADRSGLMVPCSRDNSSMGANTDRVSSTGLMEAAMSACLTTIKSAAKAPTSGQTEGCIRALGTITRWKEWACSLGQMVASTSDNTITITSMGVVCSCGRTESGTKENGAKASSMAKVCSASLMATKLKVSGRKAKEYPRVNYQQLARIESKLA